MSDTQEILEQSDMPSEPSSTQQKSSNTLLDNVNLLQQTYEKNAEKAEKGFFQLRILILFLTTLAAVLSVSYTQFNNFIGLHKEYTHLKGIGEIAKQFLVVVPILTSILLAGSIKLDKGSNWLLLKGAAEALKREVYYFRTQTEKYKESSDRANKLVEEVEKIHESFQGTPVYKFCLKPYENDLKKTTSPEELSIIDPINADQYIEERVEERFNAYRSKAKDLSTKLEIFRWIVYILGGVSTFLATTDLQAWVAVTSTLIGTISSYLELKRMETTLINYNQAADVLCRLRLFWDSLSNTEKNISDNIEKLVKNTETAIQNENNSLLQDMQTFLKGPTSTTQEK